MVHQAIIQLLVLLLSELLPDLVLLLGALVQDFVAFEGALHVLVSLDRHLVLQERLCRLVQDVVVGLLDLVHCRLVHRGQLHLAEVFFNFDLV